MDAAQVRKIAHLARIAVADDELAAVAKDMDAIIGLIDRVQNADAGTVAVPEDSQTVHREDIVAPLESAHDLVEAAPLHKDHFVQVPKVIE